jgi:hypothetical protein
VVERYERGVFRGHQVKNFRINRAQAWELVNIAPYCRDEEIVINGESYDEEYESFKFAVQVKDEAPDSVWDGLLVNSDGWSFFGMYRDGKVKQLEAP